MNGSKFQSTLLVLIFLIFPTGVFLAIQTHNLNPLVTFASANTLAVIIFIILIKIIGVIFPPINGQMWSIAFIPILGWQTACCIDLIGNLIGIAFSFYLGKKYGLRIFTKLGGTRIIEKINRIKVKSTHQIESVALLRLMSFGLSDYIAWSASWLKIKIIPLLIGSALAGLVTNAFLFYLLSQAIRLDNSIVIIILAGLSLFLFWKRKNKYFE